MALFNYANREITAKVVYYGPGVCGKTTSLQYIHERIAPEQRGRLLSLATEKDRTIFFDLLPLKLGEINGFKLRFQLYTVPGQVKYNKTRKLVLQGADAVVFVADSQRSRRDANIESFQNLQENLKEQGKDWQELPLVYSYNKRDLEDLLSVEDLNQELNPKKLPYFPAVAIEGVGIMETLEAISKLALDDISNRLVAKISTEETPEEEPEEEFSMTGEELESLETSEGEDLTDASLTFSTDELDALNLESDLDVLGDTEELLETRPIGYDSNIPIQEVEIQQENVAHTGTLKESEFFDLKDLEAQALRELDAFIEGKTDDESLTLDVSEESTPPSTPEELSELSLVDNPDAEPVETEEEGEETLELAELESLPSESDDELQFTLEEEAQAPQTEETELTFSLDEGAEEETSPPVREDFAADEETLTFDMEEETPSPPAAGAEDELGELTGLSLDEDSGESASDQTAEGSSTKAKIESLDLSESDLDLAFDEEDVRGESTPLATDEDEEEILEFSLDEEAVSEEVGSDQSVSESPSTKAEIESLDLSASDLDLAFGEEKAEEEETAFVGFESSEESPEFKITDSVRFEMQHGEEISSVTPFEKQLDELSEDILSAEEATPGDEFQPETSEMAKQEPFQSIADGMTRLAIFAKHLQQQGDLYRVKQTVNDNVLAILLYYTAIETMLKAATVKYETCNPAIASLNIVIESLEEETGKTITGKQSLIDNIVKIKNQIQLESIYPDDEECELAARICERFLSTFSEEFLSIDFAELSPVLAKPSDEG